MSQLYGRYKKPGGGFDWVPLKATINSDGTYTLEVNTELVLDSGEVIINNIKVGSLDQSQVNARYLRTADDGTVEVHAEELEKYVPVDIDDQTNPRYYGFTDVDENWYVMRWNEVAGTIRFAAGSGSYPTSWTGRAGLVYNRFYDVF